MEIEGKSYLFEKPLGADFALLYGTKADKYGNIYLEGTTRNFNLVMATAAKTVIVEADELVEGCLDANMVTIPGIFCGLYCRIGKQYGIKQRTNQRNDCRRVAQELEDGDVVTLRHRFADGSGKLCA